MSLLDSTAVVDNVQQTVSAVAGTRPLPLLRRREESQEYFAAMLQASMDAIVVIDEEGLIVEFNLAAESMFGLARSAVVGRELSQLVIPERLRERHEAGFRRYLETGFSPVVGNRIEMPAMRADGTEFPVELSVLGSTLEGRRLFTAFIRDLTRRKLATFNNERLSAIIESSGDSVVGEDLHGNIFVWNRAAERLFGYTSVEMIGRSINPIAPPSLAGEPAAIRDRLRRDEVIEPFDTVRVHKDGRHLEVTLTVAPIQDELGRIVGAMTIARDATERKWLETRLRLEDRALEQVSEGIFFIDPTLPGQPIVYVNPAFERMTGYCAVDIHGRDLAFLSGPKTDRTALSKLAQSIHDHQPCSVEILNYRANGEPFWSSVSVTPLQDSTGRVTHFVGVQSDVTRRRSLEEQLRQSQKMDALGRLAGGIAHDFNNLLTIILGNVECALNELVPGNSQLTDWILEIGDASRRAAELTKQVLIFSRKQSVEPKRLQLNGIIASLDKLLRRLIGEDVNLIIKMSDNLGLIQADSGQLEQVLMNLAVNARDAMSNGGSLIVETTNIILDAAQSAYSLDLPPGPYVKLAVTDTGVGIAPDVLPRIFEPFYTTKLVGQGTGMGLATVFGIVKQSGGGIIVQSEPGEGATFQILFPRVGDAASPTDDVKPTHEIRRGSEQVLVVEDEPQLRRLVCGFLQAAGYSILEAQDGEQAIQTARQHGKQIQLLVTDVIMPSRNGREVADEILMIHPQCKVLYMSGYTQEAMVKRGILPEGTAFLQKPFNRSSLTDRIRELLDAQTVGRTS